VIRGVIRVITKSLPERATPRKRAGIQQRVGFESEGTPKGEYPVDVAMAEESDGR
jgi:hypothetical protein